MINIDTAAYLTVGITALGAAVSSVSGGFEPALEGDRERVQRQLPPHHPSALSPPVEARDGSELPELLEVSAGESPS